MQIAKVNGVELEYEVTGAGEPVLLIGPVLADSFLPFVSEPALREYQLIRYHKRGWVGSTHAEGPVSVSDHAADAIALLDHLSISQAHVAGHSSGAAVAVQMALDDSDRVATLALLELTLFSVPSAPAFLENAAPVFEAYGRGAHEEAVSMFLSAVSGLDWATCRSVMDESMPGSVELAIKDADTFFGVELPALTQWTFDATQAATITQPVLSVLGANTEQFWVEVAEFLRSSLPHVEERTIEGVGHLLHIQQATPVAQEIAQFLSRNPIPQPATT